ncbi:hypothetical protein M9H77_21121 [Catharanthus roseus]|uniref:Uncharacterized protein n=1 Tax=Catharanthus roseus TaxID=4058 RepID=A0ACC0ALG0_CATRO|nr:hypothetical protein M9H77_21121 [Catharanthus roseus]
MVSAGVKFCSSLSAFSYRFLQFSSIPWISTSKSVVETIRAAVESKRYEQIPELLTSLKESHQNSKPFSFLSGFPSNLRTNVVDEILQFLGTLRPRSRSRIVYSCLLSYTLQSPNPLPLALAILQRTQRSGCLPIPQTHLLLSTAWLERRSKSQSVSNILLEMQSIGYSPDCGICNYLMLSLCKVDQLKEALRVLKGMGGAGCIPNLDTYGTLIGEMCDHRMTTDIFEMVKEMVTTAGLNPRQETVVKVVSALRGDKEIRKAVEMIEFLETQAVHVDFDAYDLVLKGCLEYHQFILAGKLVLRMCERGFIPYIRLRQRVVEGLVSIGELEFASSVRQRLGELNS